jgi:hypothetical protein
MIKFFRKIRLDLIKQYPFEAYNIFKNREIAENATYQKFNRNGRNDKSDAFRHAYYNIINTKAVGIGIAKLFSDAHESETPSVLIKEKEMELFNNNVGQQSLLGNSNLSLTQLADLIYQKTLNGNLRYLNPINFTLSAPYDAEYTKLGDRDDVVLAIEYENPPTDRICISSYRNKKSSGELVLQLELAEE